jgi:hypothetical protein
VQRLRPNWPIWVTIRALKLVVKICKQRFCRDGNSSKENAQFTVTVTAVVAKIEPLEPMTVTI